MKHILLLFTGGTIGSRLQQGRIDTDASTQYQLLQLFKQHDPEQAQIQFTIDQPLQILSENLHPAGWQVLLNALDHQDLTRYDGIIITHGTDTLAFTAAMLSIYLHRLNLPLLLVSSDLPLDHPQANGLHNFICAVDFIRQRPVCGVFVPYQNPGQDMCIHHGSRLSNCLPLSADFISVQAKPFAHYRDGQFEILQTLAERSSRQWPLQNRFARVLLIRPFPGLNYQHFNLEQVDVVLHDLYHSGTACVSEQWGGQHSLLVFSATCQQRGLPLYLAPSLQTDALYASSQQLLAHGARMIWNTSLEAAYAKLCLAYASDMQPQQIDEFLSADIAREQV